MQFLIALVAFLAGAGVTAAVTLALFRFAPKFVERSGCFIVILACGTYMTASAAIGIRLGLHEAWLWIVVVTPVCAAFYPSATRPYGGSGN